MKQLLDIKVAKLFGRSENLGLIMILHAPIGALTIANSDQNCYLHLVLYRTFVYNKVKLGNELLTLSICLVLEVPNNLAPRPAFSLYFSSIERSFFLSVSKWY